ncbi:MAG: EutN/CcmL family microcompartment protein [Terriglobia bacterium]
MYLGKVIGNVVCTVKTPVLDGKTILIVQPLDRHGRPTGKPIIALDSVGAGAGETVYWCRGREASVPWYPTRVPTETTIVAIVDRVDVPGATAGKK